MSQVQHLVVAPDDEEMRLDRWFRRHFPNLKHGRLEKLLRAGQIRVDGRRAKSSFRLAAGQTVRVPPLEAAPSGQSRPAAIAPVSRKAAEELQGRVLYRDASVIALDKPAGLPVQGGSGQSRHLDGLLEALKFGADDRPRLVHRLDKDTSGVLLLARNRRSAARLTEAFRKKTTQKVYWALVAGVPDLQRGRIDRALEKRGAVGFEQMGESQGGKAALTFYQVVQSAGGRLSWLLLIPESGRTHQLRAHCALIGHPIVGDGKYGGKAAATAFDGSPRKLMLLAKEIALPHPDDGTTLRIEAPLPPHMAKAWRELGFDAAMGGVVLDRLQTFIAGQKHSPSRARD